jgi:NAD(P)-dependent dehydrogenase (short-subunit alcohol dehydrogenase family)
MSESISTTARPVWLVTGASSGFGKAICTTVLERGDRLVATARDVLTIEALVEEHREQAAALQLDVTDTGAARRVVGEALNVFERLDVVVNNAGYAHGGAIEELTEEELRQQFEVNLFGLINMTRAVLPQLRKQRSGHLVQISSLNGIEGLAGAGYYAASKFAIEGLSESLAQEVAHLGIKVTIVEPGPLRTRFANPSSAPWAEPIHDYADSVGPTREALSKLDGNQPGDPVRAARVVVDVVEGDQPPLRLPLGQMAVDNIRTRLQTQLDDLNTLAEVSASSDFPGND